MFDWIERKRDNKWQFEISGAVEEQFKWTNITTKAGQIKLVRLSIFAEDTCLLAL